MSYSSVTSSTEEGSYSTSASDDSFTSSSHLTYDHRFLVDHSSNSLMGLSLNSISNSGGGIPTTNKLTHLNEALPVINAYLSCKQHVEEHVKVNHNGSLGSTIPMGQLTDVIPTSGNNHQQQQQHQPFVLASNLPREKQVALQRTHNLVPNNNEKKTTATLVHYNTLSDSELNAIKINSEKLIQSKSPIVTSTPMETKSKLVHYSTLSASELNTIKLNSEKKMMESQTTTITPKLCNTEDLSHPQLCKIRNNSENIRSFQNTQSILKSRAFEDIKFSSTISNPIIKNLYMGNPIESTMLSVKEKEGGGGGGGEEKKKKKWKCGTLTRQLKDHHPYYCGLYEKTELKNLLLELSLKNDKDFIIIIPSPEFLKSNAITGSVMALEIIASHIALFHTKDKVPIMNDLTDSSLYEYQTLIKGRKIELRRLDHNTIEVNGRWIAKLDEHCGGGHIYIMHKFVPVLKVQPKQNPVLKKAEKTTNNNNNIDQGPELIDIENDPQNLEIVRVEEELPIIIDEKKNKKIDTTTKIEENGEEKEIIGTSVMLPVHSHILYNSPKMSILVTNMLKTPYDAKLHLGSYLNNTDKEKLITSSASPTAGNIYLKTYSADDIYTKTQMTAMRTKEYLRPISSYTIGCEHSNIIDIDHDIKMKEYKINTGVLSIRKSELINHIAVISFPLSCGEKCSSVSFQVSDEATSKDVYLSTDQNILLRFNENLLDTISINANVDTFPSYIIADDEFNGDLNDMVSLQLSVNKSLSNKIYKTEISFQQFNAAILPFCAPRIIRRFKSGGKALLSDIITLSNSNRFSVSTDFKRVKTETKQIMIMYGDNRLLLLKNRKTLTFSKDLLANGDEKIERYLVDGRNSSKLSFSKQLVTKKGKSRLLSITLPDPLQSNKLRAFVFKLGNTADVGKNGNIYYSGTKGGLRMYFELDNDGNLFQLYVSYLLRSAENLILDNKVVMSKQQQPPSQQAQLTIAQLLHNEAIHLHEKNMRLSNTFLDMRIKNLCRELGKIDEKKKVKEFFIELKSDIINHIEKSQLKMPVTTTTTQFAMPSKLQEEELINSNYFTPHETMRTQFNNSINTHISSSPSPKPIKISDTLIKLACCDDDLTMEDQKIYFHRLTGIIETIISKL
jgi:hypothetical protein